jgi:hypothetical protein
VSRQVVPQKWANARFLFAARVGTDRKQVCDSLQESGGFGWWLAVLSPALVLVGSQIAPWCRRHTIATASAIGVLAAAGWTYALLVVSGNIGG